MIDRAKLLAKEYFDDKGYKNADINIMQREDVAQKNQVILDIIIDKKEKMKVRQIIIDGNENLSDSKIKGGLFRKGAFKKIHEAGKLSSFLKSKNIRRSVMKKTRRTSLTSTTSLAIVMR